MIRVEGLTKDFKVFRKQPGLVGSLRSVVRRDHDLVRAVDGIGFAVEPGEIVGFIGPNGAGKTTTLKMLSGLLHPSAGRIEVAGFVPKERRREYLCRIALVMGNRMQLAWDLTAADSLLVNKAVYGISDADFRRRLHDLAEMLELGDLVHRQLRRLSLGERMKCELIACLMHAPDVLFLDEPTIGLDVNMQLAVRRFVADYNARYGATVMLTSHYMADVASLARRILIIDRGRIVFDGDLRALMERFAARKVLRLTFERPIDPAPLASYGEVRRADGASAELLVPRQAVAGLAGRLLAELPVADIAIEEVPLEELIGQVFRAGAVAPDPGAA